MSDKPDPLVTIKETECSCCDCQRMCHRPCFGTPEDIEKLIEAGYTDRLCIDWHCGLDPNANIPLLAPALKDHEGRKAPLFPGSEEGCTFWKDKKCELHDKKLKPTQGRLAHHSIKPKPNEPNGGEVGAHCSERWKSEKGKALVKKWAADRNLDTQQEQPSAVEVLDFLLRIGQNSR